MGIFKNPFFSIAGQKERLLNVAGVVNAAFNPFSKSTVKANIKSKPVKKVVETIANHPYAAAAVGATAADPKAALAAGKAATKALLAKYAGLSTKSKVITAVAAVPTAQLFATSKKARSAVGKVVTEGPIQLSDLGKNVGKFIEQPSLSNLKNIVTESPLVVAAGAGAAAIAAAPLVAGALSLAEQKKQTKAFEKQAEIAQKALQSQPSSVVSPSGPVTSELASPSPLISDSTSPLAEQTKEIEQISRKQVAKKPKKRRKVYKEKPLRNYIRINNIQQNAAA